jgi:hypothetical protein
MSKALSRPPYKISPGNLPLSSIPALGDADQHRRTLSAKHRAERRATALHEAAHFVVRLVLRANFLDAYVRVAWRPHPRYAHRVRGRATSTETLVSRTPSYTQPRSSPRLFSMERTCERPVDKLRVISGMWLISGQRYTQMIWRGSNPRSKASFNSFALVITVSPGQRSMALQLASYCWVTNVGT